MDREDLTTLTEKELYRRYCDKASKGNAYGEQVREEMNEIFRRIPKWIEE